VVLLGDVRLYVEGLTHLLARDGRACIVGASLGFDGAADCARRTNPDVVLVDIAMHDSLRVVGALHHEIAEVPLVGLAVPSREDEIVAYAEAGVSGFVPRDASLDDLVGALESAVRGELRCSPRLAMALLRRLASVADDPRPASQLLTRRERQVRDLLEAGLTNKEIARELGIEFSTAKNHVHRLLEKLGARGRVDILARRPALGPRQGSHRT
jgi:DNA-binding NarL/FixJ family response regulator